MLVETPGNNRFGYFLFRCCRRLIDRRARGSFLFYRLLCRIGVFGSFSYRVGGAAFVVPVSNPDNAWTAADIETYELPVLEMMSGAIGRFQQDAVLIDCGADIGTFSALLRARCPRIQEIIAIEPRSEVLPWLERNMNALPVKTVVAAAAVSNFIGRGNMQSSPTDPSGHACFLAPDPAGSIEVLSIDSLAVSTAAVVLKIDVEGAEMQVLEGAAHLLAAAPGFAVVIEAHRDVVARTGIDPIEFARFLNSIRRCEFRIAETGSALDLSRPFLTQTSMGNCNIVAWTV